MANQLTNRILERISLVFTWIYYILVIYNQIVTSLPSIPEGLHVYSHMVVKRTFDPGRGRTLWWIAYLYKHVTPPGSSSPHPLWVCQSIPHLLTRNRVYSSPFVTYPLKSELLSGEAFMWIIVLFLIVTLAATRLNRAATEWKVLHNGLCFCNHRNFISATLL